MHGEGGDLDVVYLGGRNQELGDRLRSELEAKGFRVDRHASPWLQGTNPANVRNLCASGLGRQLELSAGLRNTFFDLGTNPDGLARPTQRLAQFSQAVRMVLGAQTAL